MVRLVMREYFFGCNRVIERDPIYRHYSLFLYYGSINVL